MSKQLTLEVAGFDMMHSGQFVTFNTLLTDEERGTVSETFEANVLRDKALGAVTMAAAEMAAERE